MLEMKQVMLLFSLVLQTCAAPVSSRVTQFMGNTGSDIIIKAPAGFGKPNEKGLSTVTISLRDENKHISIDVLSFIFTVKAGGGRGDEGGANHDEELRDNEGGANHDEELRDNEGGANHGEGLTDNEGGANHVEGLTDNEGGANHDEELRDNKGGANHDVELRDNEGGANHDEELRDNEGGANHDEELRDNEGGANHDEELRDNEGRANHDVELRDNEGGANHGEELSEEESEPAAGPEVLNSEEELNKTKEDQSEVKQIPRNSLSHTRVDTEEPDAEHPEDLQTPTTSDTSSLQEDFNGWEQENTMVHTQPIKTEVEKNKAPSTPPFSGSDFDPDYVSDWQYDPRYYYLHRKHLEYAAGYDPYGAGYDPYGAGYDPYQAGYDPYGEGYDPYGAGYYPYGEGYDPYGTRYDPYHAGYDNQEPHHETESKDPRHDAEQETTPENLVGEDEIHSTETSNNQENSYSEEQQRTPSISPSSTPGSPPEGAENMDPAHSMPSEEPSNCTDSSSPADPAISHSEEVPEAGVDAERRNEPADGSSSSEESVETKEHPVNQRTPDPEIQMSSHMSVDLLSKNIQETYDQAEAESQSPAELIPAFSSEEDDPLINTLEQHMTFNGRTNEEGLNPSILSDTTTSETNQNAVSFSNESSNDDPGVSTEVTHESVQLTTDATPFDCEIVPTTDSLASHQHTFSENITSANQHATTLSGEGLDNGAKANANANTADDSEESQESQIIASHVNSAENRKSNRGTTRQLPVESPAKITATNFWTSFLQALRVPLANPAAQRIVRRPQSSRRHHQQSSSEERK